MIDARVFLCQPIKFLNVCKIYPPTVNDVINNENFGSYVKLLTYSKEELQDDIEEQCRKQKTDIQEYQQDLTPLEYLLINAYYNDQFKNIVIDAFKYFIKEEITFVFEEKAIVIGAINDLANGIQLDKLRIINQDNFFDFQNLIRQSIGQKPEEIPSVEEDPVIANIKAKARKRERAKRRRASKNGGGLSLGTCLAGICCMGIGLNPLNIGEISYASVEILMEMYRDKEKYDIDISSIIAGADAKKVKPKYWIREKSDLIEVKI